MVDPAVGTYYPIRKPSYGALMGERIVEQGPRRGFGRGAANPPFIVEAMVMQSTQAKAEVILQQLNELVHNPMYGPVYVTWIDTSTTNQDGWYDFEGIQPDYSLIFGGKVKARLSFRRHAETTHRRAVAWRDTTQTTTLTAAASTTMGLPQSSIATATAAINRVAAEGSSATVIPSAGANGFLAVLNNPPVWTYRTRVYDRNGANNVPATGFTNANWIEVYGPDHNFAGDLILTNGLLLLHFQSGTAIQAYFWNQYAGSPGWTLFGQIALQGDGTISSRNLVIQQAYLQKLISEEGRVIATLTDTTAGWSGTLDLRLQRNMRYVDVQGTLLRGATAGIALVGVPNSIKVWASAEGAGDTGFESSLSPVATSYGMAMGLSVVASNLWIPAYFSAAGTSPTTSNLSVVSPKSAINILMRCGFGVLPWPVSPAPLQSEAESGTFAGGWVSAADAAASAGNAAKLPNTTVVTATDFLVSFTPQAGNYRVAARVRSGTNGAGTNLELRMGADNGSGSITASNFSLKPSQVTTGYVWFVGPSFTVSAGTVRFYAANDFTATVDWFVDEFVLIPVSGQGAGAVDGIGDSFASWLADKLIRHPVFS